MTTNISVLGIVVGAFYVRLLLFIMCSLWSWNIIAAFVNFLFNVFKDPLAAVGLICLSIFGMVFGLLSRLVSMTLSAS